MSKDNLLLWLAGAVLAGSLLGFGLSRVAPPAPARTPAPLVKPKDPVCPKCPQAAAPKGATEPMIDLLAMPQQLRRRNVTSRGLGCCTFRSAEYAAYWQQVPALYGFPEWLQEQGIPGGGTPGKQAELVKAIAQSRGLPVPKFVQYEGSDLSFIELVLKTGRPASITWNGNHMLTCVHLDSEKAGIIDNNQPDRVQWYPRDEFARRHTRGGGGWVFVLLAPPPPPPPLNLARQSAPCSPRCPCGCVAGLPCSCEQTAPTRPDAPGGMQWVPGRGESYSIDGRGSSRAQVEALMEDDSHKLHLTVIGTPSESSAALAAIGSLADRYLVQAYEPGHWALGCGFSHGTGTTVYLQARDGAVLLRASGVQGIVGKLRRTDPNYKPESDPNGSLLSGLPDGAKQVAPYAGGGGVLLILYLLARSKGGAETRPAPAQQVQVQQPAPLSALDQAALEVGRTVLTRRAEELSRPH